MNLYLPNGLLLLFQNLRTEVGIEFEHEFRRLLPGGFLLFDEINRRRINISQIRQSLQYFLFLLFLIEEILADLRRLLLAILAKTRHYLLVCVHCLISLIRVLVVA